MLYTLIVLHVAFPNIFSFENVEIVHVGIFIFILFAVDCCISIWLSNRKHVQNKKEMERKKRKRSFWITTYCFSLVITAAFFSENIPLERVNIGFGAFVFAYYFFMHFLPYMKEKRGEEEDPLVEEAREQEHKRIEEDIKKLGEQKWYLKSKIIYVLCFITPPIGYLYVFCLRKKMTEDARQSYLTVATIMMALWSLKFLPPYILAITVAVIACLVFLVKYVK
ncbi:Membrane protein [Bacillus anthracis str. SVA11]|nr:Membrane protein [Bacillus anthracis str. SVA11]